MFYLPHSTSTNTKSYSNIGLSGEAFMQELRGHPVAFQENFRMPRTTPPALRAWVIGRGLLQSKRNTRMSLDKMLGIFLWMVDRNVHVRDAQS